MRPASGRRSQDGPSVAELCILKPRGDKPFFGPARPTGGGAHRARPRGGGLTPTIDGLAARGVRFPRACAHVPMTLPPDASILTGRPGGAIGRAAFVDLVAFMVKT